MNVIIAVHVSSASYQTLIEDQSSHQSKVWDKGPNAVRKEEGGVEELKFV